MVQLVDLRLRRWMNLFGWVGSSFWELLSSGRFKICQILILVFFILQIWKLITVWTHQFSETYNFELAYHREDKWIYLLKLSRILETFKLWENSSLRNLYSIFFSSFKFGNQSLIELINSVKHRIYSWLKIAQIKKFIC